MQYLDQPHLVNRVLTPEELVASVVGRRPLKIMMGQTYDKTGGQPLDLLKYSLFMMNLQDLLRGTGIDTSSSMLIADHFLTEINKEMTEEEAKRYGEQRLAFLHRINEAYNGNTSFEFSSKLKETDDFQLALLSLNERFKTDTRFKQLIEETVPPDKRNIPNAFTYPIHELASIVSMGSDIKIGPPYELFYDNIARKYSPQLGFKKYVSIHLTKSMPLGNIPAPVPKLPHGVLPYRFGSKDLGNYRIDLGDLDRKRAERLINTTNDSEVLVDVIIIADLARQRLEHDIRPLSIPPNVRTSIAGLKDMAKGYFTSYIRL